MRVMAIDFGGRRIGIAVGVIEHGVISPKPTLAATGTLKGDAAEIVRLALREEADRIVIGLPINEEDMRMARICRQLGALVAEHGLPVEYVDESFTSEEADHELRTYGLKASERRKQRDGEAARLILERWMSEQTHA